MTTIYIPRVDVYTEDGNLTTSYSFEGRSTDCKWWAEAEAERAEMEIRQKLQTHPPAYKITKIIRSINHRRRDPRLVAPNFFQGNR